MNLRSIKNSTYFRLYEKDGFTEEILNDPEEMKEYMCWVVRVFFDDELSDRFVKVNELDSLDDLTNVGEVIKGQKYQGLFVDCPVDLYMEMFLKDHIPLRKVS